ncbi:hypothetical protein [Micromonospora sp. DT227]|uniref:hypothetical protein n=1 Tax=Micromonospora sp. DT227 TaxID=3393433 RepID=UPI003CEB34BB
MAGIKDRWNRLCDAAEDLGAQDQGKQPAPLGELRKRLRPAAERLGIAGQVDGLTDADVLVVEQLLPAYEKGRASGRIDMDEVVRHVREAGVSAFVGYDGGGATIHAGDMWLWPDSRGDQRYAVLAGPGSFTDSVLQRPFSDAGDFWIGLDDDGDGPATVIPDGTPAEQVARMVIDLVRRVEKQRGRIEAAVEAADNAFWASIAAAFPEATAGAIPPEAVLRFRRARYEAVNLWLSYSAPDEGIAPVAPPVKEPRYGYVEWSTIEAVSAGAWRFQLAESVTDLHAAWTAAVDDFASDPAAFTSAVNEGTTLNEQDLVDDYPHILARHGLTYIPDPEPSVPTINVDGDTILVDGPDGADRCRVPSAGAQLCGALLDDGLCSRETAAHRRDND